MWVTGTPRVFISYPWALAIRSRKIRLFTPQPLSLQKHKSPWRSVKSRPRRSVFRSILRGYVRHLRTKFHGAAMSGSLFLGQVTPKFSPKYPIITCNLYKFCQNYIFLFILSCQHAVFYFAIKQLSQSYLQKIIIIKIHNY